MKTKTPNHTDTCIEKITVLEANNKYTAFSNKLTWTDLKTKPSIQTNVTELSKYKIQFDL